MAASSTLSGALMYGAIQGATAGFVGGLLMSGGDLEFALKSGLAGGISGGLTSFGGAAGGWAGRIAGQSLGSGVNAQLNGGDFMNGLKYGLMGAMRSEAFQYMKTETDKLALKFWGGDAYTDRFGNTVSIGGRGCGPRGSAEQCGSALSSVNMKLEFSDTGNDEWSSLKRIPVVAEFVNMVSKTHDWMNNSLSVMWANGGSTLYGDGTSVRNYDYWGNTFVDVVSLTGMLPAAKFTARALWQPPVQGR